MPGTGPVEAARSVDIEAALDEVHAPVPYERAGTVVAVAGTSSTVTALALGLAAYGPAAAHHARSAASRWAR